MQNIQIKLSCRYLEHPSTACKLMLMSLEGKSLSATVH